MKRRIESNTSRTAQMTCMSRACSYMEKNRFHKSGDFIAPLLLPGILNTLLHVPLTRRIFSRLLAPQGIYEYVIARTRYIDAVFEKALADRFDQILIFGAGFDTRALRFRDSMQDTRVYELDVPVTQQAKIGQYHNRGLVIPSYLTFIPIDFDAQSLPVRLDKSGFQKQQRSLFILEGLLMYLQPESVYATFQTIRDYAGNASRVVFDYVRASVFCRKGSAFGENDIARTVASAGEAWQFGMERDDIVSFLASNGMRLIDHKDAGDLEKEYFSDPSGRIIARVNGTHCLVTAETY